VTAEDSETPSPAPGSLDPALEMIDHIYAAAIEPHRLNALEARWAERLEAQWPEQERPELILSPHLRRAMDLVSDADTNSQADLQSLCRSEQGVALVLSREGRICALNQTAEAAYDLSTGASALELPFDEPSKGILSQSISDAVDQLAEHIVRLSGADGNRTTFISLSPVPLRNRETYVLMRTSDTGWSPHIGRMLKDAFQLTDAEIDIVRMVGNGNSVAEITAARKSSDATVRKQLGAIYDKTGTRGHAELVRMTMGLSVTSSLMGQSASAVETGFGDERNFESYAPVGSSFAPAYPYEEHRHILRLPDGRKMSYARFGAHKGVPVIQLHDYFSGDTWPAAMAEEATRRGFDIIVPARGYYSQTDPYPAGSNTYDQFAQDLLHLLTHLEIDEFILFSRANGAMFILPILDLMPGRVRGMVGVSATAPPKELSEIESLPAYHRIHLKWRLYAAPMLFEFMARVRHAQYRRNGPKWYLKNTLVYDVEPDIALLNDPVVFDAMEKGLQFCTTNRHRAGVSDFEDLVDEVWERSIAVRVPSIGLYGSEDPLPRAQRVKAVAEAGAPFEARIIEGAGQLLFYSHSDLLFDAIEEVYFRKR